jgi:hypothetical protein
VAKEGFSPVQINPLGRESSPRRRGFSRDHAELFLFLMSRDGNALREESPVVAGLGRNKRESYLNSTVDRVMDLGEVKGHRKALKQNTLEYGILRRDESGD